MKNFPCAASTANTPANLSCPVVPLFHMPACCFAGATCRDCDHYSSRWCYRHKTWTDPDKWPCSEFK